MDQGDIPDDAMDVEIKAEEYRETAIVIQHDWHLSMKEPIAKFFIGIAEAGSHATAFYDVQATKLVDEFSFTIFPQVGSPKVELQCALDELKNLTITYNGRKTTFVPPVAVLELSGLSGAVKTFDVSSTGRTFVAADGKGSLVVASSGDGRTMRTLQGHISDVFKARYFPSGMVVLTCGIDLTARIWTIDSGICARVLSGHTQSVNDVGIVGIGKKVVTCSNDGSAILWNCGSGEAEQTWNLESGRCTALAVSEDSNRLAVAGELGKLAVVDLNLLTRKDIQLNLEPLAMCFGSGEDSSRYVYVGVSDGVLAYNALNGNFLGRIKTARGAVTCLKSFMDRLLVAFSDGSVAAYHLPQEHNVSGGTTSPEFELTGSDCDPIYDMCILQRTLFTACRDGKVRKYKLLWGELAIMKMFRETLS